jgi:hypothetical protein
VVRLTKSRNIRGKCPLALANVYKVFLCSTELVVTSLFLLISGSALNINTNEKLVLIRAAKVEHRNSSL